MVPAEGEDDRLLRADRLPRHRTRPPGPAGRGQSSIRHCTPRDWVVAEGQGKMLLADRAFDVNSFDLDDGQPHDSRRATCSPFSRSLALKQSIVPGFLTLIGTGKFVAASNGPVVFMEPPIRVDPQALVGWADCPSPCHHYDHEYLRGVMGGLRAHTGHRRRVRRGAPVRVRRAPARSCSSRRRQLMAEQATGRYPRGGRSGRGRRPAELAARRTAASRTSWGTSSAASGCER